MNRATLTRGTLFALFAATEPLTASPQWQPFAPGELGVYRAGRQIARVITHPHGAAAQTAVRQDAGSKS
ncbi:MAG: hypothetical protein WCA09_07945 [Burkholderiales bacterium]